MIIYELAISVGVFRWFFLGLQDWDMPRTGRAHHRVQSTEGRSCKMDIKRVGIGKER
jgi:hypothetical protein